MPDRDFKRTDHDLLVRLHERFTMFDDNVTRRFETLTASIGLMKTEVEAKADYREFSEAKEKTRDNMKALIKRLEALETAHTIEDAKKGVYINLASWGWRNWAQLIAAILLIVTFIESVIK